jgi:chitin disaccharide deacetylase
VGTPAGGAAPPLLIVNADDFGMSSAVTRAIAECVRAGRVTSTTVMANMPAFEEACALARDEGFADRVGVHLTLTEGPPLTEAMRPWCDAAGHMRVPERRLSAPAGLLRAVAAELRAQLARVRASGIAPTHVDSHQHIINGFPYARVALAAAREAGVRRVRLTRNAYYRRTPAQALFKAAYNGYLRAAGMRTTRWFTDVKPFVRHVAAGDAPPAGAGELMCHPGSVLDGATDETAFVLGDAFAAAVRGRRLGSYAEL